MRFLPNFNKNKYSFAFIVHSRNAQDSFRQYPFFSFLPKKFVLFILKHLWPVVLSKIEGLKSQKDGREIAGYVIAVPLTAKQIIENRKLAKKRIIQAIKLGEKLGAKIVGLGALTSSVTRGGIDLVDKVNINITTGHAYTGYVVTSHLLKLVDIFCSDRKKILVAIVGATGSVGSISAQILAKKGFQNLLLIDLERKTNRFEEAINKITKIDKNINIEISHQIKSINKADYIIAATNAPEALIKPEDLKSGAVVVDDAQPSDVSPEVLDREDVLAVEGGIISTPGIKNNFNFGLKNRINNFCCLGEVLILASQEWKGHYVINRASVEMVEEISNLAKNLDFTLGEFQNAKEIISENKLNYIKEIKNKHAL